MRKVEDKVEFEFKSRRIAYLSISMPFQVNCHVIETTGHRTVFPFLSEH